MIVEAPVKRTAPGQLPDSSAPRAGRWWASAVLWWLLPIAGVLYILSTGYAALVSPRFDRANGVAGNLLAGESLGQSFMSRYDDLSGVELWLGTNGLHNSPSRPDVVVHLYSGSPPEPGKLLASAVLPGGEPVGENSWHLFSFAPVPDSHDRTFYIEIESPGATAERSITLYSWQPDVSGGGDPYRHGTFYRNGEPVPGDLAFGLRYSPSPVAAWTAVAGHMSANFPLGIMLAILAAATVAVLWTIWQVPAISRQPRRAWLWLSRWSLPVVLAVALLNGVTYVLLVPPWQGPDEHAHFAYAALLYRHDLDDAAVQHLDTSRGDVDTALTEAIHASMDRHNFTRLLAGDSRPGAPADTGTSAYWELVQPPGYYWLCAAALRAVRAVGLNVDPYTNPEGALLVMRLVSLALSLGVAGLAWLAAVLIARDRSPSPAAATYAPIGTRGRWLLVVLPLTVTLLPMHAFIASVANNDILAELAVSAVFVAVVALFRWPLGVRGLVLLTTAGLLTALSAATKSSALAATIPLFGVGLVWWAGRMASHLWARRPATGGRLVRNGRLPAALIAALLLLAAVAAAALAMIGADGGAVGWNNNVWPIVHARRQATDTAMDGAYVLQLAPGSGAGTAFQMLLPSVYHPALAARLTAWARVVPPEGAPSTQPGRASILILEGSRTAGQANVSLDPSGSWTRIAFTGTLSESGRQVIVRLGGSGAGSVQFDDLSLALDSAAGPWAGTFYGGRLLNPSFEAESVAVHPALVRFLPDQAWQTVDVVLNEQPFHKLDLGRHYADMQYRSFWGNFGWVSVPLPELLYVLLGALTVTSLLGLASQGVRGLGRWSHVEWLAAASLAVFVFTVVAGFARQMMQLSTLGIAAYPQGRYLFVLMLPVCWLWVVGLFRFGLEMGRVWRGALQVAGALFKSQDKSGPASTGAGVEVTDTAHIPRPFPWALGLWLNLLLLFAGYCLLCLLVPYYYS